MTIPALELAFGGPVRDENNDRNSDGHDRTSATAYSVAPASDDALVARTRLGDRAAFEELVQRYHGRLVTAARASLGDVADGDAEDLVQDVLLGIWIHRAAWEPSAGAAVYLFGAVANRVRNVWRGRARTKRAMDRVAAASHEFAVPEHDMASVWDAVAELPARWRTAIVWRFVRDASFAQVGAAMGISENAAKKVVRRAVAALVERLGGDG